MHSDPPTPPEKIEPQYNPATQETTESPTDESDNFPVPEELDTIYNPVTQEFAEDEKEA